MTKEEVAELFHSSDDVEDYISRYSVINHKPIDKCFDDIMVKGYCEYYISKKEGKNDNNKIKL